MCGIFTYNLAYICGKLVGNYSSPMDPMGTLDWTPPKKTTLFLQRQESKPRLFDLKRIGIIAWLQSHKGGPLKIGRK